MLKRMGKVLGLAAVFCAALFMAGCSTELDDEDAVESADSASRSAVSNTATYTTSVEVYNLVGEGYNEGEKGPISITKCTYRNLLAKKTVYLVCLSGTEIVSGQSTGYLTDLLSGFNFDNDYSNNVVSVICENIPANANIILAGHSLGGMVAQQVAANDTIKDGYNIMNVVTFGSPLLSAGDREGTVKRLGDKNDAVPYLSVSTFTYTLWQVAGLNREDGGYDFASVEAHVESYARTDEWANYDVTGTKYGTAKLILDLDSQEFFQSPTSWEN